MLSKIVAIFLIFIMVLGIFGKLRFPGQAKLAALKCPECGRHRIGKGLCPCRKVGQG